jgi:lipoprotein-anchoring transpeptidase ErfK/SrfK
MNKVILVWFRVVILNISLLASSSNNPYLIHNSQQSEKSEQEFILMLYAEHNIAMEKKRLKQKETEAQNKRLKEIEEERQQAKIRRLLKLQEDTKRLVLEIERLRIVEARLRIEREKKAKIELDNKSIFTIIDISKQKMKVFRGKKHLYTWKVSTGKNGYRTPRGNYKPTYITSMHYSKKYNNSPMPYTVFFHGGYAIHGTKSVSRLGRRASHGCVRLHTKNAKKFYSLVRKYGKKYTKITIVN